MGSRFDFQQNPPSHRISGIKGDDGDDIDVEGLDAFRDLLQFVGDVDQNAQEKADAGNPVTVGGGQNGFDIADFDDAQKGETVFVHHGHEG